MIRTANIEPEMKTARLSAFRSSGRSRFRHRSRSQTGEISCPMQERANIVQDSTVRHHRSRMSATVVAFAFHRCGYAYALAAPFGMASVLYIFACSRSHSAALRFTSSVCASVHPCPGNGKRRNDAGTYRNPSPRPPPAILSGRGGRSHALELLLIHRHPAAARCAHDSLCLSRFSNHRIRMERRHRRFLQYSVGVNRPGAFRPGSDHASKLPIVCYCQGKQPPHPKRRAR